MREFFIFFYDARGGIFVFLLVVFALLTVVRVLASLFALGRFAEQTAKSSGLAYVIVEFFTKLIDDFRHLLALLLVTIFALILAYALWKVRAGGADEINKALQAVMATLGGLIGSIVGYYFGESAARKAQTEKPQPGAIAGPQLAPDTAPMTPVSDGGASTTEGETSNP